MSWLCLVCECIHALCLSNFARPSLPSFFGWSCLLHTWIRSPSRPLNEHHLYTSLFASPYKFGAPDCILGPDLGPILVLVLGSIFGPRFGALDFVCNCKGPKRCPKMEPETGTKIWPESGLKMQSRAPNLYWDANKVYMIFIQRSNGRSDSIVQLTTSNKEGRETWAGKIAQFTCRRYTVKSHAGENQQHACYYGGTPMRHRKTACFGALVLEPHFDQIL